MSGPIKDCEALFLLSPAVFNILLALAGGDKHSYGLQAEANAEGQVNMGPGTLYGSIKRMLNAGLICESDKRPSPELDRRQRRYYGLSELGRKVLQSESRCLVKLAAVL